jgi:hypothetical protein
MNQSSEQLSLMGMLRKNGRLHLLTTDEIAWLADPEVSQLSPQKQWDFINTNRKVGFWVHLFTGGLRLLLLIGATIALFAFALIPDALPTIQDQATQLIMLAFGVLLLIASLFLLRGFIYRLQNSKPLPDFDSIFF